MTNRIQLAGGSLPTPQYLYPTQLAGVDVDVATSHVILSPGDAIPIPAGSNDYLYDLGAYSVFQWSDPITGTWRGFSAARTGVLHAPSNGVNLRVANLTGCPIGADISNGGSGYSQATATITANVGGSTWQPVVGGSLSVSTINVQGGGFTMAPIVLIPAPASPGVPATAYATLTGTSVTGVTLNAIGAGYTAQTLTATIVPNPSDPNLGSITNATVTLVLNAANSGKILAALCTNNGAPLATISALTLTAAGGAGSGATIVPQVLQTVTGSSIVAGGAAWGTATAFAKVLSVGGFSSATETIVNPQTDLTGYRVRPMEAVGTTNAGGTITGITINDAGLFLNTPTTGIVSGGTLPTTLASITLTTGSSYDTVLFQPL